MKNKYRPFSVSLLVLSFVFWIGWGMWHAADAYRSANSQVDEPKNAYMVHIFEKGPYLEQLMCSSGDCVLFRTAKSIFHVNSIEIQGTSFIESENTSLRDQVVARGIYCPGAVELVSCFEVVFLKPVDNCSKSIIYLGFEAPLFPGSCLIE